MSHFASSADGKFVAQVFSYGEFSDRSILGVFDTTTHQPVIGPIDVPVFADSVVFSPDDSRIYLSGGRDGTVLSYSLSDPTVVARLEGLSAPADSRLQATTAGLAFVTGGLLAVGSVAGPVRLVDPISLRVVDQFDAPRGTTERFFAIDDGRALIGVGFVGQVRLDVVSRSGIPEWEAGTSDLVTDDCNAFTVAERFGRYYCGDTAGGLEERDLRTGGLIRQLNAQNGNTGSIWLAKDQTELVAFGDFEPVVSRWRLDGSGPVSRRMGEGFRPISYSPDGKSLLVESGEPDWAVIDPRTGTVELDSTRPMTFPDWRADGTLNTIVDPDTTPNVVTLDPKTGRSMTANLTLESMPDDWFVSPHRAWLYYRSGDDPGGPGEIWTIDTDTNTRIEPTLHVVGYFNGSGSDSGDRVAVGTFYGMVIFDGRTGETLHDFSDSTLRGANIVGDDRLIAVGLGGEMTVYDLTTFKSVATLGGLPGYGHVGGSDDGSLAVASGTPQLAVRPHHDGNLDVFADMRVSVLYDLTNGEQIGDPITTPDNEVVAFALRPDGKELAVGGGTGHQFTVWDLDPQHWLTAACRIAGRNLTPQEWTTNIGDLVPYHRSCADYD